MLFLFFALASFVFSLQWNLCGRPPMPTTVTKLEVSPSPLVLGKNITAYGSAKLAQEISSTNDVNVDLAIYRDGTYLPCVFGFGSCPMKNVCSTIKPPADCPLAPYGVSCSCPFKPMDLVIPAPGISFATKSPGSIADGNFNVTATVTDASTGKEVICVNVIATVTVTEEGIVQIF